jgi:hypothetical protein
MTNSNILGTCRHVCLFNAYRPSYISKAFRIQSRALAWRSRPSNESKFRAIFQRLAQLLGNEVNIPQLFGSNEILI